MAVRRSLHRMVRRLAWITHWLRRTIPKTKKPTPIRSHATRPKRNPAQATGIITRNVMMALLIQIQV